MSSICLPEVLPCDQSGCQMVVNCLLEESGGLCICRNYQSAKFCTIDLPRKGVVETEVAVEPQIGRLIRFQYVCILF